MKTSADIQNNLNDIQGNILRAYKHPHAAYCFWYFSSPATGQDWLRRLLNIGVTSASIWPLDPETGRNKKPPVTTNCALTYAGLEALGVDLSRLSILPNTFRDGMRARAEPLGDTGDSAPEHWERELHDQDIHIMVMINAVSKDERDVHVKILQQEARAAGVIEVAAMIEADFLSDVGEHFGFQDGIGQPSIEGGLVDEPGMGTPKKNGSWIPLKPGEFIQGYTAERELPPTPDKLLELSDNSTYLVFRKLQQNVVEFRSFLANAAKNAFGTDNKIARERIASNLVGRWPSGAPLVLSPREDPGEAENNFRYKNDPDGIRCPLGAHIRRCNPRDALLDDTHVPFHRILRRGMPYGPSFEDDPDADRGIVFMALNADIEAQFEFVQEQWINNGEFAGLSSDERDPLIGANNDGQFTLPGATQSPFIFGLNSFVTTRGGGYFLMPGIKALGMLADGQL